MHARLRQHLGYALWNVIVIGLISLMMVAVVIMLLGDRTRKSEPTETIAYTQKPEPQYTPGSQARALIAEQKGQQGQPDLDMIFSHSKAFISKDQLEDAHLLLFYAARLGHVPSARALASMYDPNHHSKLTSIMDRPDPAQAYKWYKLAAGAGDSEAQQRLAELRVFVEQSARKGDDEAKLLLLQWR